MRALRFAVVIALVAGSSLIAWLAAYGQTDDPGPEMKIDCTQCHDCAVPTAIAPCLKACPRTAMVHQTAKHDLAEAPDSLLLDELVDLYQAVRFNHRVHAQMSEMGSDCATCHHYSPPGRIPPCKECHAIASAAADLRRPNLKGAYHRQCLSCHREWSHDTKCIVCHIPVPGKPLATSGVDSTDIMGAHHPVVTVPMKKVYQTPYKDAPVVTFQHKEHVDLFGFRCVDCHRKESCSNCHDIQKTAKITRTQEEVHAICGNCHVEQGCGKCHDTKERPGFSHNTTGWPLNRYHRKLDCWACHPTGKRISKLSRMCVNCHAGWNQETFKHAVTGLQLDEVHSQLDCTDCHEGRKYEEDPVCSDCHDDGRTAKSAPPGKAIQHSGR